MPPCHTPHFIDRWLDAWKVEQIRAELGWRFPTVQLDRVKRRGRVLHWRVACHESRRQIVLTEAQALDRNKAIVSAAFANAGLSGSEPMDASELS